VTPNAFNLKSVSFSPQLPTASWKARPPTCVKGGRIITKFIIRTDENGKRWEINLRENGTFMHRLEGDASWLDGWPPLLPPLKDRDTP
jgi:hypothetical protein